MHAGRFGQSVDQAGGAPQNTARDVLGSACAYLESETIPAINIKTDIKKLNSTTIKPRNRRISNSSEKSAQHCETTITLSYLRLRSFSSKEVTPSNFPTKFSLLFVMALYWQEFSWEKSLQNYRRILRLSGIPAQSLHNHNLFSHRKSLESRLKYLWFDITPWTFGQLREARHWWELVPLSAYSLEHEPAIDSAFHKKSWNMH